MTCTLHASPPPKKLTQEDTTQGAQASKQRRNGVDRCAREEDCEKSDLVGSVVVLEAIAVQQQCEHHQEAARRRLHAAQVSVVVLWFS